MGRPFFVVCKGFFYQIWSFIGEIIILGKISYKIISMINSLIFYPKFSQKRYGKIRWSNISDHYNLLYNIFIK